MDTSCITLRPFRLSDSEALLSYLGDDRIMRYGRWNTLTSKDDALTFIQDICLPHPWLRSICIYDYSVGFVLVSPGFGDDRCRAEIGYAIAMEYWGQGITTLAVKMAVRQVFKEFPDVVRVQGFVQVENMASQRVLEKAGFTKEGVMRKYAYIRGDDKLVHFLSSTAPRFTGYLGRTITPKTYISMDLSRVTLRPFRVSDSEDLLSWAGDDRVMRFGRWKTLTSVDEASTFIREVCIPHPWRRSVCIDDRSIGFVSVFPGSGDDRCRADIGYAIAVEYWGQGITTQAVKMAVRQVFEELPDIVRMQGFVHVENKASQRVLEKAGFTREGVLRKYSYLKGSIQDLILFSFLSTDMS